MKKYYLLAFLFSFFFSSHAQPPAIQWQRTYGGSNEDYTQDIKTTNDGGYILAGETNSSDGDISNNTYGDKNAWIVKTNNTGNIQWEKTFGGQGSDGATSIAITTDGGYIFAGHTTSTNGAFAGNHGQNDTWIVKLNSAGDIQWQKVLGGSLNEYVKEIKQTADGGYIFVGQSESNNGNLTENNGDFDYWIVKLDTSGNIQWQKSYGGSCPINGDSAEAVIQTSDNGYLITGYFEIDSTGGNANHQDFWILKLDTSGNIVWQKKLGGSKFDHGSEAAQTSDGGYIIVGDSESRDGDVTNQHGFTDIWVVKLDSAGNIIWQKTYGSTGFEMATDILQTNDNGYIICGINDSYINGDITSHHGRYDCWVLKINATGVLQWQKSIGGTMEDIPYELLATADGGYVVAGYSNSTDGGIAANLGSVDGWVIKLGPGGNMPPVQPQYVSLLGPGTGTETVDTPYTIAGQVLVSGVTNIEPNISGQTPGIQAWVGVSPPNQNIHPMYWSNWVPATHNAAFIGNSEEYIGQISCAIGATYYYATRFLLNDGSFAYGGINSSGQGNFWDGTNYKSGVLTIPEPPLQGIYNTMVERLNGTPGTYYFTNETISSVQLNEYRTINTGNFYPQGGTPGSTGTNPIAANRPGYSFKRVGFNIAVEDQILFEYWGNNVYQTPAQFSASTHNPATGVIVVEYSISFSAGDRTYRSTYTPVTLGNNKTEFYNVSYYPNPVKDMLNITGIDSDFSFEIYNLIGQQVSSGNVKSGENRINMSQLERGTYIVKIISGSEIKSMKIIRN